MSIFRRWEPSFIFVGVSLFVAVVSSAQNADDSRAEVLRLRIMLQQTHAEMFSRAQLSPHGLLDPGVQSLGIYAAQLERRLRQSSKQLVKRDLEPFYGDLTERFELISADLAHITDELMIRDEPRPADPSWRRVNVDGKEYYLVPVRAEKRPPAAAKSKLIHRLPL